MSPTPSGDCTTTTNYSMLNNRHWLYSHMLRVMGARSIATETVICVLLSHSKITHNCAGTAGEATTTVSMC